MNAAEAAKKFEQTADDLRTAKREAVKQTALQATTIIRAEIKVAAPRGVLTPRHVKVGAGYKELGSTDAPYAEIRPRGPIGLIEGPIRPHEIRARGGKRRKRALAGDGFGPVASVHHPGTRGKHPWEKGVARAVAAGGVKMISVVSDRMLKVWTR